MKKKSTILKEIRQELHYWQGRVRMDYKSYLRAVEKVKEVARKMREVQKG
jgi:hypothetical protein